MSDLIKRDSIRADVALYMGSNAYLNDTALDVLKMIDKWLCEMEAVDAEPVRHGEWIDGTVCVGFYECSQCRSKKRGNQPFFVEVWNYCPNCGAKMGGKQDAD